MNSSDSDRNVQSILETRKDTREHLEQLFKTYYVPLCDYARAILGDAVEAEDVVQDLFTRLWNDKGNVETLVSEKSYLYASTRYRALNVLKHKAVVKRNHPLLLDFIEELQQEGYSEEEELKIERIKAVLDALPPRCRSVFTMSCLEGKTYREIAVELGISVNTVKFHVKQAYKEIHAVVFDPGDNALLLLLAIKNCL